MQKLVAPMALALLALAGFAHAEVVATGQVVADLLSAPGPFSQQADGVFLHADDQAGSTQTLSISGRAAKAKAYQWTDEFEEAAAVGLRQSTRGATDMAGSTPTVHEISGANVATTAVMAEYVVDAFAAQSVKLAANGTSVVSKRLNTPYLTEEGIRDGAPPTAATAEPSDEGRFSNVKADQAQVLSGAASADLRLRGSFVLELYGVTTTLTSGKTVVTLESGRHVEPAASGIPADNVRHVRDAFVRIEFTNADINLNFTSPQALQWTATTASMSGKGMLLEGVSGTVHLQEGETQLLSGGNLHLDGVSVVALAAASGGLRAEITGIDESGNPYPVALNQAQLPSGALVVFALAGAAAALLVGLVALMGRRPTMADVEAALEARRYRAAARAARRILLRSPGSEDAWVSRAIALSKAGEHRRVVHEVSAHLQTKSPSDGVLHYVLGLSYLEMGREAEGRQALAEAVRRTPSLMAQVPSRVSPLSLAVAPDAHRDSMAYS